MNAGSSCNASSNSNSTHLLMERGRGVRRRTPARGVMERGVSSAVGRITERPTMGPSGRCVSPTRCSGKASPPPTCGAAGSVPYGVVATPAVSACDMKICVQTRHGAAGVVAHMICRRDLQKLSTGWS